MGVITGELRNEWEKGDRSRRSRLETVTRNFFGALGIREWNDFCYFMREAEEGHLESKATANVIKDVSRAYDVLATLSIQSASCRWVTPHSTTVTPLTPSTSLCYRVFIDPTTPLC